MVLVDVCLDDCAAGGAVGWRCCRIVGTCDTVLMSDLIKKARAFAHAAHDAVGQRRKYTEEPYWRHVDAVAELVASVTDDEITIAAAYLHDTVEDTPTTFDDIAEHFGAEVATVVVYLTDISKPKDGNRATRKAIDRAHNARGDNRVHTIKLADLIDNAGSIAEHDPHFAAVYMEEKRLLLDVLTDGDVVLMAWAREIVDRWFAGE